ncbi:hypothetical protein HWV62_29638 [Athelia sp. TMB]|nr:hypothetical protein HWV62_29638 [Athelia sp. TMB]
MGAPVAVAGIFTNQTIEGTISLSSGVHLTNMVEEGGTDKGRTEKFVDWEESASEHPMFRQTAMSKSRRS